MPRDDEVLDPEDMQHMQPLITQKIERTSNVNKSIHEVKFKNFDENEEATKIH